MSDKIQLITNILDKVDILILDILILPTPAPGIGDATRARGMGPPMPRPLDTFTEQTILTPSSDT